jgi:uncharacterized protein YutE (UPF0331/DUF86 family)
MGDKIRPSTLPCISAQQASWASDSRIIPNELAIELGKATGFRNVLIHEYVDVVDNIVSLRLADLGDLRGFARAIARWALQQLE